ncbi:hypothetical protein BDA96_01G416400 [Sorghum bicolor]|uniref:Uncharacterized protein n=1 Tax=Sorghum bicolor TaxID=4558 RepID=A0A921S3E0_SORBI|nr:hypothetical protein BDA96_01G416400 [Sorghum bicolor]
MIGGFNGPVRTAVTSGRCIAVVVFTLICINSRIFACKRDVCFLGILLYIYAPSYKGQWCQ